MSTVVAIFLLAGAFSGTALATTTGPPVPIPGAIGLAGTYGAAPCATLNSNASLNATYSGLYDALPNDFKNWTLGPNETRPLNQSGYPRIPVGERQLIDAWLSICNGPTYRSLYNAWGPPSITGGMQLNGSTGDYQVDFGFIWHAVCTNGVDSSYGPCEYMSDWYVDLVTGQVDGPLDPEFSGEGLGGAPTYVNPAIPLWNYVTVGAVAAIVVIAAAAVRTRRGRRRVPPPPSPPP